MRGQDLIEHWMERFKNAWLQKDIDAVFALLSDDVEYWETPFLMMGKDAALRTAWEEILPLEDMKLAYEIYAVDLERNRYGVRWEFVHTKGVSAGVYLIELDPAGLCTYFYHSAQSKY